MKLKYSSLLVLTMLTPFSYAATPFIEHTPQAFTFEMRQQHLPLGQQQLSSQILDTELTYPHSPYLQIGALASKTFDRIENGKSYDLDGYQVGMVLRVLSPHYHQVRAALEARYRYHHSERSSGNSLRKLRLHHWQAIAAAQWNFAQKLEIYGGFGLNEHSGIRHLEAQDSNLSSETFSQHFIGLDYNTDPGGHIGIELNNGDLQSFGLYFQRRY
jgi:hypothetical protein